MLAFIDRSRRAIQAIRRAGFDFDKDKAFAISKDQVDFTMRRNKISRQKLAALLAEILARGFLAQLACAQVFGPRTTLLAAGIIAATTMCLFATSSKIRKPERIRLAPKPGEVSRAAAA